MQKSPDVHMEVAMLLSMRNRLVQSKSGLLTLVRGEDRAMHNIVISALAATCLVGAVSVGNADDRRHGTHDPTCAYVWNGFTRVPSCQMLAPIKSSRQETNVRSEASLEKRVR